MFVNRLLRAGQKCQLAQKCLMRQSLRTMATFQQSTQRTQQQLIVPVQKRTFAKKGKKNAAATSEADEDLYSEDAWKKQDDFSAKKDEDHHYESEEEFEDKKEFKKYRQFGFYFGKFCTGLFWTMAAWFAYHYYQVVYSKNPEEAPATSEKMYFGAFFVYHQYRFVYDLLTKPPVESLLLERPPLPPGYAAQKVLVLNVAGLIAHSEYKLGTGFEIIKRPGLSVFLQRLSKQYEIVLFGDMEKSFIEEIGMALDPNMMMFQGHLGRESTIVKDGKYIKDFSYLGRPIKDIVYIDFTDQNAPYHKMNTIILPEFDGDTHDRALYDIMPFLDSLGQKPVDVRDELKLYGNRDTAETFTRMQWQRKEHLQRQQEQGITGVMTGLNSAQQRTTGAQSALMRSTERQRSMGMSGAFGPK